MKKLAIETEQFKHFVENLKESFWGDVYGKTKDVVKELLEADSEQQMERYLGLKWYERSEGDRIDSRNGYYERDLTTILGPIRMRVKRTRKRGFLPRGVASLERRSPELTMLIREAFLRGISTRQVGRVIGMLTDEPVSAQTVSRMTRSLDAKVSEFHKAALEDEWAYLFLDGVWMRVRRPAGPQKVLLLVAYGVKATGERQLIAFLRAKGESQQAWEGLLNDLHRRGLTGRNLKLIVTDGCAGLAAAIQTVYPRALHQRCWVHKMRNILEKVRKRDHDRVKRCAQAIYLSSSKSDARVAFKKFKLKWQSEYPSVVKQLERDLPELLNVFNFPRHLWRKLRTTNVIERCFVEVRRRTRPMVVFTNVQSVDRIVFAIFHRFNEDWKNRTLDLFTQAA